MEAENISFDTVYEAILQLIYNKRISEKEFHEVIFSLGIKSILDINDAEKFVREYENLIHHLIMSKLEEVQ